jgi:signal peptidase II
MSDDARPAGGDFSELRGRHSFLFFGVTAASALLLDIGTKAWVEAQLGARPSIVIFVDHLSLILKYNQGGAWGLFRNQSEFVRLPFFLAVNVLATALIFTLYGRLTPAQRALKWGLPLVLGGALGNLSDRIVRTSVVDFIDYRAGWVLAASRAISRLAKDSPQTDHWPTFNVGDVFICVGLGLVAIDLLTNLRRRAPLLH